jgi:hypothetical protein
LSTIICSFILISWPLHWLSFTSWRLITPLVSSNFFQCQISKVYWLFPLYKWKPYELLLFALKVQVIEWSSYLFAAVLTIFHIMAIDHPSGIFKLFFIADINNYLIHFAMIANKILCCSRLCNCFLVMIITNATYFL